MIGSFLTTLKELREKATAGPWEAYAPDSWADGLSYIRPVDNDGKEIAHHGDSQRSRVENEANSGLICYLVNHAQLIEEMVECARAVEQTLNAIMNECDVRHVPIDTEAASYCAHKAEEAREQAAAAGSALSEALSKLNGGAA